jgi:hypothetical protein
MCINQVLSSIEKTLQKYVESKIEVCFLSKAKINYGTLYMEQYMDELISLDDNHNPFKEMKILDCYQNTREIKFTEYSDSVSHVLLEVTMDKKSYYINLCHQL